MNRRKFLKLAGIGSLGLFGFPNIGLSGYRTLDKMVQEYEGFLLDNVGERAAIQNTFSRITQYRDYIKENCSRDVSYGLIKAIIATESNGDPRNKSGKGAAGLMQLMPGTARELGIEITRFIDRRYYPEDSIRGGVSYLNTQIKNFSRILLGLAAYNCGPAIVEKLVKESKGDLNGLYWALPGETQKYIVKVLSINGILKNGKVEIKDMPLFSKKIERCSLHVVSKGECLRTIAKDYDVGIREVEDVNPEIRDPSKLDVEQKVRVPAT